MLKFHFASSAIFDTERETNSVLTVMRHNIQTIKLIQVLAFQKSWRSLSHIIVCILGHFTLHFKLLELVHVDLF